MRSSPSGVDLEELQRLEGDLDGDLAGVAHLGDVADATKDPVGDARRAARAARDLLGGDVRDRDAEDSARPPHDGRQLGRLVVRQPEGHAEAVTKRRGQQAGARGRADKSEGRQVERERPGRRPLADDDVQPEVLERRIEDLLDRRVEPVDLVDEQHIARLERGQDRRQVALALDRRSRDGAQAGAELLPDDVGKARLAEAGRAHQQYVIESLVPCLRCRERDVELLLQPLLPDELVESSRPERAVEVVLLLAENRRQELWFRSGAGQAGTSAHGRLRRAYAGRLGFAHAAFFSATRTRSSAGSSRSTPASACSASPNVYPSSTRASRATRCESAPRLRHFSGGGDFLLQLEHDALRRLLADARDRLEARGVLEHDRPAQLGGRGARDDRQRDFGADAGHGEQLLEQLTLGRLRKTVELQRVLANVGVDLERNLALVRPPGESALGVAAMR